MKRKILIPLLFSLVITVLIILVIPLDFNKYQIEQSGRISHLDVESIAFADLNGDGIDDFIECGGTINKVRRQGCACRFMDESSIKGTIDQINVPNLIYGSGQAVTSDFDKDGIAEIWLASAEDDQLYIYGFEGDQLGSYKYRIRLDSIYPQGNKYVAGFSLHQSHDINDDGFDELFFYISNRFPIYPRRVYRVDIKNDDIVRSPRASAGFPALHDFELPDGTKVFTSPSSSPGNHKDSVNLPYPDTLGYIYAFNQDLKFLFEPIPFSVYPSGTANFIAGESIVSFQSHRTSDSTLKAQKRDFKGNLLLEASFEDAGFVSQKSPDEFLIISDGKVMFLDSVFQTNRLIHSPQELKALVPVDLNGDGENELFSHTHSDSYYIIFDHELENYLEIENETGRSLNFHLRQYEAGKYEFVLFGKNNLIFYRYLENPYYYFQIPYYLSVFILALVMSSLAFRYYRKSIEKRFDQEREFNRLQILSLKNQIDPHFALNTLNSVDWMYKSGEVEKATKYMETYSRLMHQTVTSSDKVSVTLYDELNFCRKYCELEKLREPEFDYSISVDDKIDSFEIPVPRQIVFTHLENAIKHGLRPKDGEKRLKIEVTKVKSILEIVIKNNGVAYKKKVKTSGTGKGLEILKEMSSLYSSLTGKKVFSKVEPGQSGQGSVAIVKIET